MRLKILAWRHAPTHQCYQSMGVLGLSVSLLAACTSGQSPMPEPISQAALAAPFDHFQPVPEYTYLPDPGSSAERAVLARLEQELSYLQDLLREAQSQRKPSARTLFRYDLLQRDLDTVRHGIRQHLQGPGTRPRVFEPLRGDYRG
ncbi:MAG: RAQPRD family integrative conjugative element protein [Candidatus Competibacteraceae bacterium]|nr:RAQPRD family integrative conjugative element protein [Candidatus Competibacteraceae bacterium]